MCSLPRVFFTCFCIYLVKLNTNKDLLELLGYSSDQMVQKFVPLNDEDVFFFFNDVDW